jgi:hypothetical protein
LKLSLYQRYLYFDGHVRPYFDSFKDPLNALLYLASVGQLIQSGSG